MGDELVALGGAFLAAGLLARLGRGIGLPTIPFFMAAGILTGPHTPGLVLVENPDDLELFAAIGLILLLFHLGLEFSLGDLIAGGSRLLSAGAVRLLLSVGGGLVLGFALGWGSREAFVVAGAVGISSSAIVTKLLVELGRLANPETRLILGIIVVEDVFLALYLAALAPILGGAEGVAEALLLFGRALSFLIVLAVVARYGARWVGRLVESRDDELLTVLFVGLAILVAGVAEELGVSAAIGAFMVGLILAETAVAPRVERLVLPLRDAFAAVFFFAFGLTIDPRDIRAVAGPVVVAVAVSLVLNVTAGLIAARSHRLSRRAAANVALTTLGRGEFSLILATFAVAAGLDARIGPFVALYVLILAVAGPLLASRPGLLAAWLPQRLFVATATTREHAAVPGRAVLERDPSHRSSRLASARSRALWRAWLTRRARTAADATPLRRLRPALAGVAALFFCGVLGYIGFGFGFADALYMTALAVTTTGFQPAGPLGDGARYFTVALAVLGAALFVVILATIVGAITEGGLGLPSRRRRMEERIENLRDHFVICAYGRVGRAAARQLEHEDVPFVVIDVKEDLESQMRRDGVLYLIGDPTSEAMLRRAGIDRARGLICAVDSDATNVYITLMARSLNPEISIVARASEPDSPDRLYRAGANRVISPYVSSGRHMALLAVRPRVVDYLEMRGRRLEELSIEDGSPLVGQTLRQACVDAVPLLVQRATGETIPNPDPDEVLRAGDLILLWGEAAGLRQLETA